MRTTRVVLILLVGMTAESYASASYSQATGGDLIDEPSTSPATQPGKGSLTNRTAATSLSELTLTTIGTGQPLDGIIGVPNGSGVVANIATPEPDTLWLLGISGLLIAVGSQRKRLTPNPRKTASRER